MPFANPRNCGFPACRNGVLGKRSYCPEHSRVKNKEDYENRRRDDIGEKLYSSKPWSVTRRYHLAANPYCVDCLKLGIENASDPHVDHIVPLKIYQGNPLDETNLQTLCRAHHSAKTRADEKKG